MRRPGPPLPGMPLLLLPLLAACSLTRHGSLEEVGGALRLAATVTVRPDGAWVRAVDPRTGEVLEGFLAAEPAGRAAAPAPHPEPPLPSGAGGLGAAGAGVPLRPLPLSSLRGELRGRQGTALQCTVVVARRLQLRGTGLCHPVGPAASGPPFRLHFQ